MYVYILQSLPFPGETYTGITENLKERLIVHNLGESKHTAKFEPWKILTAVWLADEAKARALEKYLKTGSGRAWARKHLI
jgi:predicted GIY-YIG superfamily endonuclease